MKEIGLSLKILMIVVVGGISKVGFRRDEYAIMMYGAFIVFKGKLLWPQKAFQTFM